MLIKNRERFHLVDYLFLGLVFLLIIGLLAFLWTQLVPLWTMKIVSQSYDISTCNREEDENPLRLEIIADFDKLSLSKLAYNKILTMTLKEKPDVIVLMGRVGANGRTQKKLLSMFYLLSRFNVHPEKVFVIPDRKLYEYLIGDTKILLYYVDFFNLIGAEVEFEGKETIGDSVNLIMASSVDRIEFLKGPLHGTLILLSDYPGQKIEEVEPEVFIIKGRKVPHPLHSVPFHLLSLSKGVAFLSLY